MKRILTILGICLIPAGLLLWAVLSDVFLGPTKDYIAEKFANSILNKQMPGNIGAYILILLIILSVFTAWTRNVHAKSKEVKQQLEDLGAVQAVNIKNFMKDFTSWACRSHYVIATQLYSYEFRIAEKESKVKYEDGHIIEGQKINALLQEYFKLDSELFSELKGGLNKIEQNSEDPQSFQDLSNLIKSLIRELNAIKIIDLTTDHAIKYSLLYFALQYIDIKAKQLERLESQDTNTENSDVVLRSRFISKILKSQTKEKNLNEMARTGILRSILNAEILGNEFYVFEHHGQSDKSGRIYLTFKYQKEEQSSPYIFLITISHKIKQEEDPDRILNEVVINFKKTLKEKLG